MDLVQPWQLIFDGVFQSNNFHIFAVDVIKKGIQGSSLTTTCGAC